MLLLSPTPFPITDVIIAVSGQQLPVVWAMEKYTVILQCRTKDLHIVQENGDANTRCHFRKVCSLSFKEGVEKKHCMSEYILHNVLCFWG